MLKSFVAHYLKRYIKGMTGEQVSARILEGKVTLKNVDLNLAAVADLLVGVLPYTLELSRVACKSVTVRLQWQSPRRHPLIVEVHDCHVEIAVHAVDDPAWLAKQLDVQHKHLVQAAVQDSIGPDREEEEEQQKQLSSRDVDSQLRVGLDKVIPDGLRVSLKGIRVSLLPASAASAATADRKAAEPAFSPPSAVALSIEEVSTVPCTQGGAPIKHPEDVYEVRDRHVHLYRQVEVRGFSIGVAEGACPLAAAPLATQLPAGGAPSRPIGFHTLLEHADAECGPIRVRVEQRRLAGFIPNHRARRVCPFSSETIASIHLQRLITKCSEKQMAAAITTVASAICKCYVPMEVLPPELARRHWRAPLLGGGPEPAAAEPLAAARWLPAGAWESPASPTSRSPSCFFEAGQPQASCLKWSAPVAAAGLAEGFELRRQLCDRQSSKLVTVRLEVVQLWVEISAAPDGASGTSAGGALASVRGVSFAHDTVVALQAFEARCLEELGLLPAGYCQGGGGTPATPAAAARFSPPTSKISEADDVGSASEVAALPQTPRTKRRSSSSLTPGTAGSLPAEPTPEPFLIGLNSMALTSMALWWCPAGRAAAEPTSPGAAAAAATGGGAGGDGSAVPAPGRLRLVKLGSEQIDAVTLHWKDLPPAPTASEGGIRSGEGGDPGWQPMEGCVHGVHILIQPAVWLIVVRALQRFLQPIMDAIKPPPLDSGWLRVAVHDVELEVDVDAALEAADKDLDEQRSRGGRGGGEGRSYTTGFASIPALMLSSVPELGELFLGLEALPQRSSGLASSGLAAEEKAAEQQPQQHLAPANAALCQSAEPICSPKLVVRGQTPAARVAAEALREAMFSHCACGRELAGGEVRIAGDFVPVRGGASRGRAWHAEQLSGGSTDNPAEYVAVQRDEFVELVKAKVTVEAASHVLQSLRDELRAAAGVTGKAAPPEEEGKKKGNRNTQAQSLAARWATLTDEVRCLREKQQRIDSHCTILRGAVDGHLREAEAQAGVRERDLAASIALERARQAELSARAEEQQQLLNQLLHGNGVACA